MKKIILVTMAFLIFFDTFLISASANTKYNHSELMEYNGYGQAMYESIVEQTTFMTGHYTENKEYVSQSIDEIINYANFWKNEFNDWDDTCSGLSVSSVNDCITEAIEKGGGLYLSFADWIKNLFNDYESTFPPSETPDYSFFESALVPDGALGLKVKEGWTAIVTAPNGKEYVLNNPSQRFYAGFSNDWQYKNYSFRLYAYAQVWTGETRDDGVEENQRIVTKMRELAGTVSGEIEKIYMIGASIRVQYNGVDQPFEPTFPDRNITTINNYIQDNPITLPVPQLKPSLVCPDGTKIQMSIDGSTFVAVDGSVMLVNKDGTAEVNGAICNLNWEKPIVQYNPDTGQPEVIQPDGTKTDLDTGETDKRPIDIPSHTDLKDCEGIMCGIGKVLDGLGGVIGALGDFVLDLLKGLKDLLVELFVPDADFFAPLLTQMRTLAVEKLKMEEMKKLFDGLSGGGEAVAVNEEMDRRAVSVMSARSSGDMFAINPDDIVNTSFIDDMLPTVHSWVRGFFYPLLIYFNLNQLYKMIRGTSLFGGRGKDD